MGRLYHLFKEIMRLLANHAIGNSFRVAFLKLSGVKIGKGVFVNQGTFIVDNGNKNMVIFEDYVTLAPQVTLITRSSPYNIHPEIKRDNLPLKEAPIRIREGTWIGTNVTILPGVTIGKCCMIGANSLITKDIPDFSIAAGSPAKVIRRIEKSESYQVK